MTIDLPPEAADRLATLAEAAGYESVETFVAEYLLALAEQTTADGLPKLSEADLRASVEMVEKGLEDMRAGRVKPLRQALDEIATQLGLEQSAADR